MARYPPLDRGEIRRSISPIALIYVIPWSFAKADKKSPHGLRFHKPARAPIFWLLRTHQPADYPNEGGYIEDPSSRGIQEAEKKAQIPLGNPTSSLGLGDF